VAAVPIRKLDKALATVPDESADVGVPRPSQATALVQLAIEAGAEPSRDVVGEEFVTVMVGGHRETWLVRKKATEHWLGKLYFDRTGAVPNAEALRAAANILAAKLRYRDRQEPVGLRVAEYDGRLYLDLCDRERRAVETGPDGWRVIVNPPVRFWRPPGMLPLPVPERGGSIDSLRQFLNVRTGAGGEDALFYLAVAWLLAARRPHGPYPVLALAGEHGSAKSSFARVLRSLVDPNSVPLRSPPRDDRDLFIAARNSHSIVLDNLSDIPGSLSDSLCRLATGGGFATRQLRTDAEEVLFSAMRPIIVNGIGDIVTGSDLADRTIFLTLNEIPEERRREEQEFWTELEVERPRILGALLDAVAHGMKMLPATKLTRRPRMADFARWVAACEGALWKSGTFTAAYDDNRHAATETALAVDAVATAVRSLMAERDEWEGTATELLATLAAAVTDARRRDRKWPANGKELLGRLRRVTPELRHIGITVEQAGAGVTRIRNASVTATAESEQKSTAAAEMARADEACSHQEAAPRQRLRSAVHRSHRAGRRRGGWARNRDRVP
jgi:hypothetical protein